MSLRFVVACFGAILIFSSGVAVGQKTASSRFEKYLVPAERTEMDMRLLEANLKMAHGQLEFAPGIGLPRLFYDRSTRKVKAVAFVREKFLDQQKTEEVKKNLEITAGAAFIAAALRLPELQWLPADPDFEVEFIGKAKKSVYAEYKNGELTIH